MYLNDAADPETAHARPDRRPPAVRTRLDTLLAKLPAAWTLLEVRQTEAGWEVSRHEPAAGHAEGSRDGRAGE